MSEYRSTLYCQESPRRDGGTYFDHFAPHPEVSRLYSGHLPVYEAVVEQIEETPGCYWAWWDDKAGKFTHVYYWRGGVEMCFPYGTEPEIDRGKGLLMPVKVTRGSEIPREMKAR